MLVGWWVGLGAGSEVGVDLGLLRALVCCRGLLWVVGCRFAGAFGGWGWAIWSEAAGQVWFVAGAVEVSVKDAGAELAGGVALPLGA